MGSERVPVKTRVWLILTVGFAVVLAEAQNRRVPPGPRTDPKPMGVVTGYFGTLALERCWQDARLITCRFRFSYDLHSRDAGASKTHRANYVFHDTSLVDNQQRTHRQAGAYFLDGSGNRMPVINLRSLEEGMLVQEFEGAGPDVKMVRLVAPRTKGGISDVPVPLE